MIATTLYDSVLRETMVEKECNADFFFFLNH